MLLQQAQHTELDKTTIKNCWVGVNLPDLPRVLAAMYAT